MQPKAFAQHLPKPRILQSKSMTRTPLHICIIGGGFGGFYTALYLKKYKHLRQIQTTLIEPNDQFLFTPMLYELITRELEEWEVAPTYTSLLTGTNITWKQTRATRINLNQQTVTTEADEVLAYTHLVVATGAKSRPVDIPGANEHALTFRSLQDAQLLTARLAQLVQMRSLSATANLAGRPIRVTVIGGGASGVELAGKVSDYLGTSGQVTLVERGETILKHFEDGLRRLSQKSLSRRKVRVLTHSAVLAVKADAVIVQSNASGQTETIPSQMTLWAVGTQPREWIGEQAVAQNERGQLLTERSLQLLNHRNVFILGDAADMHSPHQKTAPNTAQAAFQSASRVAANMAAITDIGSKRRVKPFNYLHLGDMLTLGLGEAGLWSFGLTLGGPLAAIARRVVYIFRMPTRHHQLKVARRTLGLLIQGQLFKIKPKSSRF